MNTSSQDAWTSALERSRERLKNSAEFWPINPKGTTEFSNARKYYKAFSESPEQTAPGTGFAVDTQGLTAIGGAAEDRAVGDLDMANQFLSAMSRRKGAEASMASAERQASATRSAANSAATGQIVSGGLAAAGAIGAALI